MASMTLRGEMRKWCRFRINTGNTEDFVASYAGRSSSREWGSSLWALGTAAAQSCLLGHYVISNNVATLEKTSFSNEKDFQCMWRGLNRKVS